MSKTKKAIDLPVYQPRNWGKSSNPRPLPGPWYGLDTERDAKKGTFVCGKAWKPDGVQSFETIRDLVEGTYWVWNLGYDIEGMVRDLNVEEGWAMKADGASFLLGDARCRYYHGKRFEWRDENGLKLFLEASSFFNRISLKEAAKVLCVCKCDPCRKHKKEPKIYAHCGEGETCPSKLETVVAAEMSHARYQRDAQYRADVDKYCIQDSKIALQLIERVAVGLRTLDIEIGGTPGATARRLIARLPDFPKVVWNTHRAFLRSYCGGRFEIVKRGYFEKASQFDIVSAYPWALSKCPLLTETAWSKSTTRMSDDAHYGAYRVEFLCDSYFGVAPTWRKTTRVFSSGEKDVWISKPELELIHEWGGRFRIIEGVEIFDENASAGWASLIAPWFRVKQEKKNAPEGLGAKVGLNSIYGGLIQLVPKGGEWVPIEEAKNPTDFAGLLALEGCAPAFEGGRYYAPCYASHLTSLVRRKVLETCADIGEENVVGAHTDSILCVKGGPRLGTDLGEWTLESKEEELLICKSGQYAIGDKVKARGIHGREKALLYAPKHQRRMRVSVKSAKSWEEVSLIRNKEVVNNIGWELKRVWERELSAKLILNHESIDSKPLKNVQK